MEIMPDMYQLKWNAFSAHLHSCVASAINNTTFADVALYTLDGQQILAHRFVLSACSQYLHQILQVQSQNTNLPLVIVLPPEISHKTMTTLIQYMYSGEATVSKDILQNVLRGGDLLKVEGLWKHAGIKDDDESLVKVREHHSIANLCSTVEDCSATITKNNAKVNSDFSTPMTGASSDSNDLPSQFLVIKDEPIEWKELEGELVDCTDDMFHSEMTIKPESDDDDNDVNDNDENKDHVYSPLTCELCSEVFALPGDWVRHIQSHTDMLPAKRQRRGKAEDEAGECTFPPLQCDMCQECFETPADWVRHIESSHTETELSAANKTSTIKSVRVNKHANATHKTCTMCTKKFPSHASMLIHRRTHTGERPFMCDHCHKGFNVKSNLLRHLRTLHDCIVNSADIEHKDD